MNHKPFVRYLTIVLLTLGVASSEASAMLNPTLGRFMQRDTLGYVDGMSLLENVRSNPVSRRDPHGTNSISALYKASLFTGHASGSCCDTMQVENQLRQFKFNGVATIKFSKDNGFSVRSRWDFSALPDGLMDYYFPNASKELRGLLGSYAGPDSLSFDTSVPAGPRDTEVFGDRFLLTAAWELNAAHEGYIVGSIERDGGKPIKRMGVTFHPDGYKITFDNVACRKNLYGKCCRRKAVAWARTGILTLSSESMTNSDKPCACDDGAMFTVDDLVDQLLQKF